MGTGFQNVVNNQPAPAESGDFYGVNPRAVVLAGPSQFVAPEGGLLVGAFCWADTDDGSVSQSYVAGNQIGFLKRDGITNTIIVDFLAYFAYKVLSGFGVTLFSQGDFWGLFPFGAAPGASVYADPATGGLSAAANTSTFTGAVATGTLTVTAAAGYPLAVGDVIVGAGVTAGNAISAQLSGTPGGNGTYSLVTADDGISGEAMHVAGIVTPFKVNSPAANGELAIISSWG